MSLNIALAIFGGLTLLFSLTAGLVKRRVYPVSEPMLATLVGVLIGPFVLGVLDLSAWGDPHAILETIARLTTAVSVLGVALRLSDRYFSTHGRAMATVLGPGMLIMWLVSGLLAYVLLGLPFWAGMLMGAVLTPADPVLAGAITTGKTARRHIPARIRHFLSAETGANDLSAYVFVFFALFMLGAPAGGDWLPWMGRTLLWAVGMAVPFGLLLGYAAARIQEWAAAQDATEITSVLVIGLALSFTTLGTASLLGLSGFVAVFAAGIAFSRSIEEEEKLQARTQEAIKRLSTLSVFVLFGMALPWEAWGALGWTGAALAAGILLLRRLPMMLLLKRSIGPLKTAADACFVGWFGPIGIDALYYTLFVMQQMDNERIWAAGSLVIASSIFAYGITSTPLTLWYGRHAVEDEPSHAQPES